MAKLFSHKCDSFTQKEIAIYKLFHSDLFSDVNVLPTAPGPTPVSFMLHFFSFKSLLLHDLFLLFISIYIKQPNIKIFLTYVATFNKTYIHGHSFSWRHSVSCWRQMQHTFDHHRKVRENVCLFQLVVLSMCSIKNFKNK